MTKQEIAIQDKLSKDYKDIRYQRSYSRAYHAWLARKMLSLVRIEDAIGCRVLDNGCGIGYLADFVQGQCEYVGLDLSAAMIQIAKQCSRDVLVGNSQELPFKDGSFDVVLVRGLLHHLPNIAMAVSEMHRVLRVGGQAIILETNFSIISALPRWIAYRGSRFSDEHKNLRPKELLKQLQSKLEVKTVNFVGYVAYPLLGFPDLVDLFERWPWAQALIPLLIRIDNVCAQLPLVRSQSWAIMVDARKW